jgi:hypothetical protein
MTCNLFTILSFALKVIRISWMNIHKISLMGFQWWSGWNFIDAILWTHFHEWKAKPFFENSSIEVKVARRDLL